MKKYFIFVIILLLMLGLISATDFIDEFNRDNNEDLGPNWKKFYEEGSEDTNASIIDNKLFIADFSTVNNIRVIANQSNTYVNDSHKEFVFDFTSKGKKEDISNGHIILIYNENMQWLHRIEINDSMIRIRNNGVIDGDDDVSFECETQHEVALIFNWSNNVTTFYFDNTNIGNVTPENLGIRFGNIQYSSSGLSLTGNITFDYWGWGESVSKEQQKLTINAIAPKNNSKESSQYIFFNVSITPSAMNISNATITIWNSSWNVFNTTTNIVTGENINYTSWNITNFDLGQRYYWNVEACGTNSSLDTLCFWNNINLTFLSSAFSELNIIYNSSIFETSTQEYIFNISGNALISSASAIMWYNGTGYRSIVTDEAAGYYKATNNIVVPLTPQDDDKEFFWEWDFVLTDGSSIKQNSTVYKQEVNRTWFTICNSTFDEQFINFTIHDATNPFPLINATFKAAWNFWLGNGNIKRNYSFEDVTETNHTFNFCMFPKDKSFYANGQLEFDATDYSQNYYYLDNAILTNTTNAIDLYLLNDSLATLTILQVYNEAQEAISNVTIKIQLYDVGTDTYYTIGMAKTSFAGEDVVYLNWYNSLYKFILTLNGEVIKTTTPYKISETPQIFEITTATSFIYDKFEDFVYNLYYNNVTKNFVLTFTKPSGLVDKGCLRVIKRNVINDTQICLVCETSSSATLYCNIAGQGNGTYIATFYATGSLKTLDTIVEFIGAMNEIYDKIGNTDGSVYAFLFAGVIVAMFFVSPVIAIIGALLGILGSIALGFQPVNYIELVGIVLIGGTIIWILKR